jgi:hypothetical protein
VSFSSSIVVAGVLIFVGGLLAAGAQRGGQLGMPRPVVLTAAWSAAMAVIAAVVLVVMGVSSLPDEASAGDGIEMPR